MSQLNLTPSQVEIIKNLQNNKEIYYPIDDLDIQELIEKDVIVVKNGEYRVLAPFNQSTFYKLADTFNGWESDERFPTEEIAHEANRKRWLSFKETPGLRNAAYKATVVPDDWTWKFNHLTNQFEWGEEG